MSRLGFLLCNYGFTEIHPHPAGKSSWKVLFSGIPSQGAETPQDMCGKPSPSGVEFINSFLVVILRTS